MKIGILTFHCAVNYGAVLQAYGLQESLKSLGHEVYIIDYRPEYLKRPYRLFFTEVIRGHGILGNIRFLVRELLALPVRYKRRCAFNKFIEKHLCLANLDFQSENNDFDCFVLGSDQIWNPQITGWDSTFWGDAPFLKGKKIITYAASAGDASLLADMDKMLIKGWLSNFSSLSVREKSLSQYLLEELQVENQLVVDPVLLAGAEVFKNTAPSNRQYGSYLLFFSLQKNDEALNIAKKKAELLGLELMEMYGMSESVRDKKILQSLSPDEFIGYFQNAEFVVSTSFHGTVFSILFHKPFICVGHNFGKSRFYSLLEMLQLQDRLIDASYQKDFNFNNICWYSVDEILIQKRNEAMSFVKNALS